MLHGGHTVGVDSDADSAASYDDEDDFDPQEAERRIDEFIAGADELGGPPVAEFADAVAELVRQAWDAMVEQAAAVPNNKVLAAQFLLSKRARTQTTPDEPEQWQLHAASTLLSGLTGQRHRESQSG